MRPNEATRRFGSRRDYLFLSHSLDNTGAPLVLLEIMEELAGLHPSSRFRVVAPDIVPNHHGRLEAAGIEGAPASRTFGRSAVAAQLTLERDSFLLLNTVAIPENYQRFVLTALETRRLDHAFWLVHENTAQLAYMAPHILESSRRIASMRGLIEEGRLTFLVPSKKIQRQYQSHLGTDKIELFTYNVHIPEGYCIGRQAEEYQSLRFLLIGPAPDGRKGQMIAIAAFSEFLQTAHRANPSAYRDFSVILLPSGDDYVSRQIRTIGRTVLGDRLRTYPAMSHTEVLDLGRECNATVCCSFEEAFPLSVAEGMAMGHILLRNDTGGLEEQLDPGVNGYYVDGTDIAQFARSLEEILNKRKTPDARLCAMGLASQERIAPYRNNAYARRLERLEENVFDREGDLRDSLRNRSPR